TITFTSPASAVRLVVEPQASATGTYWFDDMSLTPTQNLIENGGFELGQVGWNLPPQAGIDTNSADAHSGTSSLQLTATSAWQVTWQAVPISGGQTYAFTGWGRSSASAGVFTLVSYDNAWTEVG